MSGGLKLPGWNWASSPRNQGCLIETLGGDRLLKKLRFRNKNYPMIAIIFMVLRVKRPLTRQMAVARNRCQPWEEGSGTGAGLGGLDAV